MTTSVLIRTSERSTFRRCRQRWHWSYIDRLESNQRSKALTFGDLVHQALARYYVPGAKRGEHPAEAFVDLYDSQPQGFFQFDEDGDKVDARALGIAMLNGYVEKYGTDSDWVMVQPEMTFQIDVYLKDGTFLCTYVGKFDGVAKHKKTKLTFLPEHKTAKTITLVRINSGYGEQALSYWWAANMWLRHLKVLKADELIDSVYFNFLRKGMPDERPVNAQGYRLNKPSKDALLEALAARDLYLPGKPTVERLTLALADVGVDAATLGEVSKMQPSPLFVRQELKLGRNTLRNFERRIRMEAFEMKQVREGKLPTYKNPTRDCDWDCPYRDACEVHEMGGHWQDVLELDFHQWDPYQDHELDKERT